MVSWHRIRRSFITAWQSLPTKEYNIYSFNLGLIAFESLEHKHSPLLNKDSATTESQLHQHVTVSTLGKKEERKKKKGMEFGVKGLKKLLITKSA